MAQESNTLTIDLDELLNNTVMEQHSCNLIQYKNRKVSKQIKKINLNNESIVNDIILLHKQNCKKEHSSEGIRERLQRKLKEKSK